MDVVYLYRHSASGGFELRHSLRSLALHAPYIRKVWMFGDCPDFLSRDISIIEHVPHERTARLFGLHLPVRNFFLLMMLSSLIPELEHEYLRFSDDFFLLRDFPIAEARKIRYLENLSDPLPRRRDPWADCLWRTHDFLVSRGYGSLNFETHVPFHLTKSRVMEAFLEFRDHVTQHPMAGLMGATAILNHAVKREQLVPVSLADEGSRISFWDAPPSFEEVTSLTDGNATFLSFADRSFGPGLKIFLQQRFPVPCKFERES